MKNNDDYEYTILEISEELGIPKETCRQVLLVAIRKLKTKKMKLKLKDIEDTVYELTGTRYEDI